MSHSQPITSRAITVIATDAMIVLPICSLLSPRSSRTKAISGAMPNQPKKHRKNAIHVMWNVRIGTVLKLKSRILVALPWNSMVPFPSLPGLIGRLGLPCETCTTGVPFDC